MSAALPVWFTLPLLGACSSSIEYEPRPVRPTEPEIPTGPELEIRRVVPDYGSNAGTSEVVVRGTFDEATQVWFDGMQATVLDRSATELTVGVPPTSEVGWVDVEVSSGPEGAARSAVLEEGFRYWQDQTGRTGTVGSVNLFDNVGDYWDGGPRDFAIGQFAFASDTDWELYMEYAPAIGACAMDWVTEVDTILQDPAAPLVEFEGLGAGFALPDVSAELGDPWFVDTVMSLSALQPGQAYDLAPVVSEGDWPSFGLERAVTMPGPFTIREPDVRGATAPPTDRSIDLEWTGSGGDYVIIWILREFVDVDGATFPDGVVTCAVPDTGAFTVPPSTWSDWYPNAFLHVQVGRVVTDTNVLPHNNADSRVAGVYWVYGGARTVR